MNQARQEYFVQLWIGILGSVVVLLGVAARVHPGCPRTICFAVAGFVLCGTGVIAAVLGSSPLALLCGSVGAGIGFFSAFAHIPRGHLGMLPSWVRNVLGPSQQYCLTPDGAFCLAMAGLAIVAMAGKTPARRQPLISGLVGTVLVALGTVALVGYIVGSPFAYAWAQSRPMAVPSAAGTALLGAAFVAFSWQAGSARRPTRLLPLLVGIGGLTVTFVLWEALRADSHTQIRRMVELASASIKNRITERMEARVLPLSRMARRWENQGMPKKHDWEFEAELFFDPYTRYQAVAWVDSSFQVRWVLPLKGNEALDIGSDPHVRPGLEAARDRREVTIARSQRTGGGGILVCVPTFYGEGFNGFLVGSSDTEDLLSTMLDSSVAPGNAIALFEGGQEIYRRMDDNREHEEEWGREATMDISGLHLRVRVWPASEILAEAQSWVPNGALIGGLMMSVLLTWSVHLAQTARSRAAALRASQERFRELFENATDIVYTLDLNGNFLSINKAAERISGYAREELFKTNIAQLATPECRDLCSEMVKRSLAGGADEADELAFVAKNGRKFFVEIRSRLIVEEGLAVAIQGIARDTTERRRAEEALRRAHEKLETRVQERTAELSRARGEAERVADMLRRLERVTEAALVHLSHENLLGDLLERIRQILNTDTVVILLVDSDGQTLVPRAASGLDQPVESGFSIPVGKGFVGGIAAERRPILIEDVETAESVHPGLREKGVRSLLGVPLLIEGRLIGVLHIGSLAPRRFTEEDTRLLQLVADRTALAIDHARLYEAERAARAEWQIAERRSAFLAEASRVMAESLNYRATLGHVSRLAVPLWADLCVIHILDADGVARSVVRESAEGLSHDLSVPLGYLQALRTGRSQLSAELTGDLRSSLCVPLIARGRTLGAMTLATAQSGRRYDAADLSLAENLAHRAALAIDNAWLHGEAQAEIAERKRVEEQIRAALQEKEVLLKEIHHRVKNNLQIVSSLLNLQSGYIIDERAKEMYRESQNRVRSMALLHAILYQSKSLSQIDFSEYIHRLASNLFAAYRLQAQVVSLDVNVEKVRFGMETAIPCGLIINELVSNSLKHAFGPGQRGHIRIELRSNKDRLFTLRVSDDGVGLPRNLDFRTSESLGLQLVASLSDQLEATVDVERKGGTAFKFTFAELQYKERLSVFSASEKSSSAREFYPTRKTAG